jgi:hypothetical protein
MPARKTSGKLVMATALSRLKISSLADIVFFKPKALRVLLKMTQVHLNHYQSSLVVKDTQELKRFILSPQNSTWNTTTKLVPTYSQELHSTFKLAKVKVSG